MFDMRLVFVRNMSKRDTRMLSPVAGPRSQSSAVRLCPLTSIRGKQFEVRCHRGVGRCGLKSAGLLVFDSQLTNYTVLNELTHRSLHWLTLRKPS